MVVQPKRDPLSGHLGHLSDHQIRILARFKEELGDEGFYDPAKTDDATLLRFLRARCFDLPKAKVMWINTTRWKEDFKVDELYATFEYSERHLVDKLYPRFCHKTDHSGHPVCIEQFGKLNVPKLFAVTTRERQLQALVVEYETLLRHRLPKCSEAAGRRIETTCSIIDIQNVTLSQFIKNRGYIQELIGISQDHYPEMVHKLYVINAPWVAPTMWSFIKGWLAEETVAKIQILGSDYRDVLLNDIPADSLPKYLGGTCVCEEGCSLSDVGPWNSRAPSSSDNSVGDT